MGRSIGLVDYVFLYEGLQGPNSDWYYHTYLAHCLSVVFLFARYLHQHHILVRVSAWSGHDGRQFHYCHRQYHAAYPTWEFSVTSLCERDKRSDYADAQCCPDDMCGLCPTDIYQRYCWGLVLD